eukprot:4696250-Alexandrium_andersonii.AAC.1
MKPSWPSGHVFQRPPRRPMCPHLLTRICPRPTNGPNSPLRWSETAKVGAPAFDQRLTYTDKRMPVRAALEGPQRRVRQ